MTDNEVLNLTFWCDDLDRDISIRDYLKQLVLEVWICGERFSGKRPFGNSGWQYDIYKCLIENGVIEGTLDEDGYAEEFDTKAAKAFVEHLIKEAL